MGLIPQIRDWVKDDREITTREMTGRNHDLPSLKVGLQQSKNGPMTHSHVEPLTALAKALLSKKQNINSSHKSLKRALSLKRSIKDAARTARDL